MGLEVNKDDIQELVEEHGQEFTTDELMDLHHEQQQKVMEEISSEEKNRRHPSLQMRLGRCVKCGKQCNIL
jgi:predicted Zn-ribbon and HTH transcriptional regulator